MNKAEIRTKYNLKRCKLSETEKEELSKSIFYQIIKQFNFVDKITHVFIPIDNFNEINTLPFRDSLFDFDYKVATSITQFNPLALIHCIITKETVYKEDKFGIPTPQNGIPTQEKEIDIVIVPLLAFDENGARVGYGKGLYDGFLSKCRKDCIKIGVSFFPPEKKIEDLHENDILLDFCVTPDRVYSFELGI